MRPALLFPLALVACSTGEANHLGNPLTWPGQIIGGGIRNAIYDERRGRVELFVKSNHPALLADITAGGGPGLTQAMDLSGIPAGDRPARITQLQGDLGLYTANLEALIVALMVFGG
jgi:hypothetical protein